jgi:hypothetical protein
MTVIQIGANIIDLPKQFGTYGVLQVYDRSSKEEVAVLLLTDNANGQLPQNHLDVLRGWLCQNGMLYSLFNYQYAGRKREYLKAPALQGTAYQVVGLGYVHINPEKKIMDFFGQSPENLQVTIWLDKEFIALCEICYPDWEFNISKAVV